MKRKQATVRVRIISAGIVFVGVLIITRLYYLQIVQAEHYLERAERQYVHTRSDIFSRGSILFTGRDGETVSAATIKAGFTLAVNPSHVLDASQFCEQLRSYLLIERDLCVQRASLSNRTYVQLTDRLTPEQADEIKALQIDGALLHRSQWRYYPGGSVAARSIGFIGFSDESNELRGRFGLERQYDDVLFRKQEVQSVNFFAELFTNIGETARTNEAERAGNVVTTLEPVVSRLLDTVLTRTNEEFDSRVTGGIIMDPKTGAIYAMNVVPTFDLNTRENATLEDFRNPLVENVYEFGSTIKALTIAAGIDAGAINSNTTYTDNGSITLNQFTIRNFDGKARGVVDMQQVLNQSLNTGVSFIVSQMGRDRFREYFLNYGLGEKTGIDLPNEIGGLIGNLSSPRDVEYATASFGQGIAFSPIAATRALAALGNGGYLVTPHIATAVQYDDGTIRTIERPEPVRILKESTSEEISRMLENTVDTALRGGTVSLPNHSVGAKTGTAQIPSSTGGYYEDRYLHSFFGYFPVYDPQFIVFLYTIEPKGVRYASETLTDPFMEITRFLINYYSIPPDR